MKKILVFCDYYRPSVKSGGGMWTVANLVDRFSDRYEFHIITRNYDSPGDTTPYTSVKTGEWNDVGNARVYYVSNSDLTKRTCARLTNAVNPDCVFLNSVFGTCGIRFLTARRKKMTPDLPVILAPCGNLAKGALQSKSLKKRAYLAYAKVAGLYDGLLWKASTSIEADEIRRVFGDKLEPMIAPDLTPRTILPDFQCSQKPIKEIGSAKFIFLSRIVPKKNLEFALRVLSELKSGDLTFNIVGAFEDPEYWAKCQSLIRSLPQNVRVKVHGNVDYLTGLDLLKLNHFFILPTLNENFGYVIIESLAAGTPVLLSDQTAWNEVAGRNAGWVIPPNPFEDWTKRIERCIEMDSDEYLKMSQSSREFAIEWLGNAEIEEATARVLERAMGRETSMGNNG